MHGINYKINSAQTNKILLLKLLFSPSCEYKKISYCCVVIEPTVKQYFRHHISLFLFFLLIKLIPGKVRKKKKLYVHRLQKSALFPDYEPD